MIVSKTPLRISFVGGGTDLKEYYQNNSYGAVISATIDKYIYVIVNRRFDNTIKASYSITETVGLADEIKHPIIRNVLKKMDIKTGLEIISIADIPSKTGLGSSSSFTVGLLNALYAYKGISVSAEKLAREACEIEIDIMGEPIGKQDQYAAAYGGMNYIQFNYDESVFIEPVNSKCLDELNENLIMFYTGITRCAGSILMDQIEGMATKNNNYRMIRDLTEDFKDIVTQDRHLKPLGKLLDRGWRIKRGLTYNISNSMIDFYYNLALQNGALGGKLLGAGGGGFLLFYCEKTKQKKLKKSLIDLKMVTFKFEPNGSKIVLIG